MLVPFPFSDLIRTRRRPSVALADAGRGDWVLCQVTSQPYADPHAILIMPPDFQAGGLRLPSYVRPGKLFTANHTLIVGQAGILQAAAFRQVIDGVIALLESGTGP